MNKPSLTIGTQVEQGQHADLEAMKRLVEPASPNETVGIVQSCAMESLRGYVDRFPMHQGIQREELVEGLATRFLRSLFGAMQSDGTLADLPYMVNVTDEKRKLKDRIRHDSWDWIFRISADEKYSIDPPAQGSWYDSFLHEKKMRETESASRRDRRHRKENFDIFARVRNSAYVDINAGNIESFLPRLRASYVRAWLRPESLQKLSRNNADDIRSFTSETSKGVFVYGFDESVDGNPTIGEQMVRDLREEADAYEEPAYKCKALVEDDGTLLAWLTYWQPPDFSNSPVHREQVIQYLDHGVTGGEMNYGVQPPKQSFMSKVDRILLFDTLRGEVPMAAARLFAHATQEMIAECSKVQDIISYRLREIFTDPRFAAYDATRRFCENTSSDQFFSERGFIVFADDYNPAGPKSERIMPDGSSVLLNPAWAALSGDLREVFLRSKNIWNAIQRAHGDPTSDSLDGKYGKSYVFVPPLAEERSAAWKGADPTVSDAPNPGQEAKFPEVPRASDAPSIPRRRGIR